MINENTIALLPAAHMDYDTIAIERDQELFVRSTPQQISSRACLDNGSTYEGRREAVMHHFGFKRKVPIPINPGHHLFTFPTNAPTDFACNWIFYSHVQAILPPATSAKNTPGQTKWPAAASGRVILYTGKTAGADLDVCGKV